MASPPNSSFVFARWQHRTDGLAAICNCIFWLGFQPPNLPFFGEQGPHPTQCVIGPHKCTCQMASKSVERLEGQIPLRRLPRNFPRGCHGFVADLSRGSRRTGIWPLAGCANVTDKQTDRPRCWNWLAIGEIACARTISPNYVHKLNPSIERHFG